MKASPLSREAQPLRHVERTALVLNVYDALAEKCGLMTVDAQAAFHGVSRIHWSAIRNGRKSPGSELAFKVAEQLQVDPRAIWRRERRDS